MSTVDINPEKIDFFTDETVAADSAPYFDHMLAHHPVWRDPKYGVVIVTGYEEALQVYHQPDVYSSINRMTGPVFELPFDVVGDDISELLEQHRDAFPLNDQIPTFDPPMHTDHRAVLMGLITPKRLKENEGYLKELADEHLAEILPKGSADLVWDYAKPFTILAIADLLGVPEEDRPMILDLLATRPGPTIGNFELQVSHENSLERVYDYFVALIERRRKEPLDDIVTGMAQATFPDGSLPTAIDVARIASNLFAAGQETTVQVMSIAFARLAEDPDLQDTLRKDPKAIPRFLEETLRLEAPIKGSFRITKKPTALGGVDLPVGTSVLLLHGAAGRDPRQFENPGDFDVDRANARQHLAFGRGIHTCPGAPLARAEVVFTIEQFLAQTERFTLSEAVHGPVDDRRFFYIESYKFRGHTRLQLDLVPKEQSL